MTTKVCKCCGANYGMEERLGYVQAGPVARRLLDYLARQNGRFVTTALLTDVLYADDPDGGPDNAALVVRATALKLRPRLAKVGLELPAHQGSGYALRWAS